MLLPYLNFQLFVVFRTKSILLDPACLSYLFTYDKSLSIAWPLLCYSQAGILAGSRHTTPCPSRFCSHCTRTQNTIFSYLPSSYFVRITTTQCSAIAQCIFSHTKPFYTLPHPCLLLEYVSLPSIPKLVLPNSMGSAIHIL